MARRAYENDKTIIRASEIGQYHFCPAAWYLQRCGFKPESTHLNEGLQKHDALGVSLTRMEKQGKHIFSLRLIAILIFLLAIVVFIREVVSTFF
jgi:hypothetical protein